MDPLTEKVARAICREAHPGMSEHLREAEWRAWVSAARAAIRAMFEGQMLAGKYSIGRILDQGAPAYIIPESDITAALEDSNAKP